MTFPTSTPRPTAVTQIGSIHSKPVSGVYLPSRCRVGELASHRTPAWPSPWTQAGVGVPAARFSRRPACSPSTLGQGLQRGVFHRHVPLVRDGGSFFIRSGRGDGEGQLVSQGQTQLLMAERAPSARAPGSPSAGGRILRGTPEIQLPRPPCAAASGGCAELQPSPRFGGTSPTRAASSCSRSWSR